jgi:hypothetical protein
LDFVAYSHHGFEQWARTPAALLFVWARSNGRVLQKYQGYSVDRTVDGNWAVCGDPYPDGEAPPRNEPRTVPLRFPDEVVFDDVSRWSAQRIAETYPANGYEIVDGKVHCTRGVHAEDLARYNGARIREQAKQAAEEASTADPKPQAN